MRVYGCGVNGTDEGEVDVGVDVAVTGQTKALLPLYLAHPPPQLLAYRAKH